jgi:squalene-hopene/tetraprenyl-beta-curcumene cyclase
MMLLNHSFSRSPSRTFFAAVMAAGCLGSFAAADEPSQKNTAAAYEQMVGKAVNYLITNGQAQDGSFSSQAGPGVSAIATTALLRHGVPVDSPAVSKALKHLESFIQPDGGIYKTGSTHANYETCLAILCFNEANKDRRYDKTIARADAYIKGIQWDEGEDKEPSDPFYGGAGYGGSKRPDLSNTSFLIDALKAAGNDENSEAIQRALIFVSRCQNLETEHNTTPFAAKNPDGGFYYTPAAGGASMAGKTDDGGLRSYASMTYSGLKSMIYAGVDQDDPRVKAATAWIRKHYGLEENPGMGAAGLYYYYHVFAKALDALGQDTIQDENGAKHEWRAELIAELANRQQKNGSWINEQSNRWLEGDANLVTAYALLAARYCQPEVK